MREAQRATSAVWQQVDLLMVPTAPGHPRLAEVDAEPIAVNAQLGTYTNFVNLLGWCALALPASFTARGLPFGVTFIAPHGHDAALARFGGALAGQRRAAARRERPTRCTTRRRRRGTRHAGERRHAPDRRRRRAPERACRSTRNCSRSVRTCRRRTRTAPHYRLFALPGTTPPKPGLLRVADGGAAIVVELWALPAAQVGAFLASIAAPLGLGSVELADGRRVHGFLCEAHALAGAIDITAHGGWRAYLVSVAAAEVAAGVIGNV